MTFFYSQMCRSLHFYCASTQQCLNNCDSCRYIKEHKGWQQILACVPSTKDREKSAMGLENTKSQYSSQWQSVIALLRAANQDLVQHPLSGDGRLDRPTRLSSLFGNLTNGSTDSSSRLSVSRGNG